MIAFLRGRVASLAGDAAIIEVGGVGLEVQCAPGTLVELRVGESAQLATVLVVREDSLTLFGFRDADERQVFELLQTVSGIGPRLAQAILGVHPPDVLRRLVATEDLAALTTVPGVGRKSAQRLVLELKEKLGPAGAGDLAASSAPASGGTWQAQVHGALLGLGWSNREAEDALAVVAGDAELVAQGDVPSLLRAALRTLGPR